MSKPSVLLYSAFTPSAVFWLPFELLASEFQPCAVLLFPVVAGLSALTFSAALFPLPRSSPEFGVGVGVGAGVGVAVGAGVGVGVGVGFGLWSACTAGKAIRAIKTGRQMDFVIVFMCLFFSLFFSGNGGLKFAKFPKRL